MIELSARLLIIYGTFLIVCGIMAVVLIGFKAKTALASGGLAGILSLGTAYLLGTASASAPYIGIALTVGLFLVFSWRSAKTLFTIFGLIPTPGPELRGKGIAFLIISLMAVVSVFVSILQILYL